MAPASPQAGESESVGRQPACKQCRARRVKCDRRLSGCLRCERMSLTCSYNANYDDNIVADNVEEPGELTQALTKRRRSVQACISCRAAKVKCSGSSPCLRCQTHAQDCIYSDSCTKRQRRIHAGQPPPPTVRAIDTAIDHHVPSNHSSPASTPGHDPTRFEIVNRDVIRNYVDAFFDKANYFHCPFLHKATVIADLCQKTLEPKLVKAICALGLRLSSNEPDSCCYDWMDEVQRDIVTNISNVSLSDLQALMLVIQFRSLLKFTDDVWNLLSIAARVAFTKRLNYERPKDDSVQRESLRRLMWSIFIMDKDFSGGIEDLTICPVYRLHIRLPNSNHNFQLGLPSRMQYFYMCGDDAVDTNATAYLIKMFDLRDRILRYTRHAILLDSSPYSSRQQLRALDQELTSFKEFLPGDLQLNPTRLMIMCHSEDARSYTALHTFLFLCSSDLFRFLIPGIKESVSTEAVAQTPLDYIQYCQQRCLHNAVSCCDLWDQIYQSQTRSSIDRGVLAISIYQCAKIIDHLHHLLSSQGLPSLPVLKAKLRGALSMAARPSVKCEWIEHCLADVGILIPRIGNQPHAVETPLSSETTRTQKRIHFRSNYVFAPEGEVESDSAANPLVVEPSQAWPAVPPSITVPSTYSWPFSLPDGDEDHQALVGANTLNLSNGFVPGAPGFNTALHNSSFSIPTDPLDLQMNAYSNI